MPTFKRLEIWSDVSCNSGARVASFDPGELTHAVLTESLTGTEQLQLGTSRELDLSGEKIAELVHARIVRVCWSDTSLDTEWRLSDDETQSGQGDDGRVSWIAMSLVMDLARIPFVTYDSSGNPSWDIDAIDQSATDLLTDYVDQACADAGLYPVSVGTVEYTNTFDFSGSYQTALEAVRAITAPGKAPGDFYFRRNGTTDYKLDILTSRGSSAATVRCQTNKNLLKNVRTRSLTSVGTIIIPRGADTALVARGMERAYWKVLSAPSTTTVELGDPKSTSNDGPGLIADQLKDLYLYRTGPTFVGSSVTASSTASLLTVGTSTDFAAGDYVEFRRQSGSTGARVVDVRQPSNLLNPVSSGYGPRFLFYDVPSVIGDANLVPNPWTREWATSTNPPDGWRLWRFQFGVVATSSQATGAQSTTAVFGGLSYDVTPTTEVSNISQQSPVLYPLRGSTSAFFSAHVWARFPSASTGIVYSPRFDIIDENSSAALHTLDIYNDVGPLSPNVWTQYTLPNVQMTSASTSGVRLQWRHNTVSGVTRTLIDAFSLSESTATIPDVEYSGGTVLHQAANTKLAAVSSPIAGYQIELADLSRLDGSAWDDEPLVLGGNLELIDTELSITTTQRVVEVTRDLLEPLNSQVILANLEDQLTTELVG